MKKEIIWRLQEKGVFSPLDIHFASFMERLAGENMPEVFFGAALVSSHTRRGHICLDLSGLAGTNLLVEDMESEPIICPELNDWSRKLRESIVFGSPGEYTPLIIDEKFRCYLFRYWEYETKLANFIRERVETDRIAVKRELLKEGLERLFPCLNESKVNWQKIAAFAGLVKRFCVISGGPGTGKTSTVGKILALLVEQSSSKRLRIALTAPTGKAASRLQMAIQESKERLNCPVSVKEVIPEEATTIHRLLGSIRESPSFRYNVSNKLPFDVVVVDEASMVDLPLMSKLVEALPLRSQFILLGDKDQLASVEGGAAFGDICDTGNTYGFSSRFCKDLNELTGYSIHPQTNQQWEGGLSDCIVELQKNYRFSTKSGIAAVSSAVKDGDGDGAIQLLKNNSYLDIRRRELQGPHALLQNLKERVLKGYMEYCTAENPLEKFGLFDRFRVLCPLREGPYGVVALNSLIEGILAKGRLIRPQVKWYQGRPVMITRNDYGLGLFNGDVGLTLQDPENNGDLRIFFKTTDGTLRKFHPLRLPEHETVYAMTVHKSQGSEFMEVILLLPERDSPVLTRELIYTGITRAKESVLILGSEEVFCKAVSRRTERTSGLRDALWRP